MKISHLQELFKKTRDNVITSGWEDMQDIDFENIDHLNSAFENRNFNINNYPYYEELLNFMNVKYMDKIEIKLNEPIKYYNLSDYEKREKSAKIKKLFTHNNEDIYATILFSNPNSGKTKYLHSLIEGLPESNLSIKNTKNSTEWQSKIYIENINGEVFIGSVLKMIANSTIYNDVPHFIHEDEVGGFELDSFLGQGIKGIFKSNQRVDILKLSEDNATLKDLINEIKKNGCMSLKKYIEIGEILKAIDSYKIYMYEYHGVNIPVWIPKNLYFLFASNYEFAIAKSLHPRKGWGSDGNRFYSKHLYNCGLMNDENIIKIDTVISPTIENFNENFLKKYHKIINSNLSQEDKMNFKSKKHEFLVSNFYKFDSIEEKDKKNELTIRFKDMLYELSFEDIDAIVEMMDL